MRKVLILLGAPGCGKGTQSARIIERYGFPQISTGDILRDALKRGTPMGIKAKEFMDRGELVADEVLIGIIRDRLQADDCRNGFILDGFPRTLPQAEALQGILDPADKVRVVLFDIHHEILVKRLTGRRNCPACNSIYNVYSMPPAVEGECDDCHGALTQRADDREDVVRNRLAVYEKTTAALIPFYQSRNILTSLDAEQDVDSIFEKITEILG
jgi:adenylate kinase